MTSLVVRLVSLAPDLDAPGANHSQLTISAAKRANGLTSDTSATGTLAFLEFGEGGAVSRGIGASVFALMATAIQTRGGAGHRRSLVERSRRLGAGVSRGRGKNGKGDSFSASNRVGSRAVAEECEAG